jgi:DNA polymerase-3 subunit delta'
MDLLLHSSTKKAVNDYISYPSHALLLLGPLGSGKGTLATHIASKILDITTEKSHDHPYIMKVTDDTKGISIETIRSVQTFLQLKTPGRNAIRRALIIEHGESMSIEAQNAFLKILEEPPNDTIIIITSLSTDSLLPTIKSRAQQIKVLPVSLTQSVDFFGDTYSEAQIRKAYFTSDGYIGLTKALLDQDATHPLVEQIAIAKSLLASTTYERLIKVDELTKQKNSRTLLQAFERICHASLNQALQSNNTTAKQWTNRLKLVVSAQSKLRHNPQSKLLLTDLMLNL